jgi:hypothetical protein
VHHLLAAASIWEAVRRLQLGEMQVYAPFTLGLLERGSEAIACAWDGATLECDHSFALPLSSSSFRTEEVIENRRGVYERMTEAGSAVSVHTLRSFHRSHDPERGAYSVCMHREDARTVSFAHVCVREDEATLDYAPGSPCSTEIDYRRELRLTRRS